MVNDDNMNVFEAAEDLSVHSSRMLRGWNLKTFITLELPFSHFHRRSASCNSVVSFSIYSLVHVFPLEQSSCSYDGGIIRWRMVSVQWQLRMIELEHKAVQVSVDVARYFDISKWHGNSFRLTKPCLLVLINPRVVELFLRDM